ncbi:MAG: AAA-like domain-containing protein [Prochloraceae cyanobacterium]
MDYQYIFAGTLPLNNPTYIKRQADEDIYNALKSGQFCYVFNARKSGKSSLRVRVMNRLLAENINCAAIDLSLDEVQLTSSDRWYFGILDSLTEDFDLDIDLDLWWSNLNNLSGLARFKKFIETVLLVRVSGKIVLFFDEIDSVLSLPFSTDDFFAFIRACYNRRVDKPAFDRLTFCLLGVATPSTLIKDKKRTPFNIGKAIDLSGFTLEEAKPLAKGFVAKVAEPEKILAEILFWTGGQPFLTQKLCYLALVNSENKQLEIGDLVKKYILENWESQDEPEHLKTIRDRLIFDESKMGKLLDIYQQVLEDKELFNANSSAAMELRLSGIVLKKDGKLKVYNPIYKTVFDRAWIGEQLSNLRPYDRAIAAWLAADKKDDSRLLRGQALRDSLDWKVGKILTSEDEEFLAASEQLVLIEKQRYLDAARTKEAEAKLAAQQKLLAAEKKNTRLQKIFLAVTSAGLIFTSIVGIFAYANYKKARIKEIETLSRASLALFASNNNLDALVEAIKAKEKLAKINFKNNDLEIDRILQKAFLRVKEYNRLTEHQDRVYGVAISENIIASASRDRTVKLWQTDGKLLKTLTGHQDKVYGVAISEDGKIIASASWDKTVKLWQKNGTLLHTLKGHQDKVYEVAISQDGKIIASASADRTVKLWDDRGNLLQTLTGHQGEVRTVAMTPDGKKIVSASEDRTIKLWQTDGTLLKTIKGHSRAVRAVAISDDGKIIASASRDRTVKLWHSDGREIVTLRGHTAPVYGVAIGPDNKYIASASADNTVKLWRKDGTLIDTFKGHNNRVWSVAFSVDGKSLVSGSWDRSLKLWQVKRDLITTLIGHRDVVIDVDLGEKIVATASDDETVKLWDYDGTLLTKFDGHTAEVYAVKIASNNNYIASGSADRTILIWQPDGTIIKTLKGHQDSIWSIAISPDNKYIISGSADRTVKIWSLDNGSIETLKGHTNAVRSVIVSPDGKYIISASEDNTLKIWHFDGPEIRTLKGHSDAVTRVAISRDGKTIASTSDDRTVKLWTIEGKLIKTLNGHDAPIWGVSFSQDSQILASASEDKTVILWNLNKILQLNELEYSCAWLKDYLSDRNLNLCQEVSKEYTISDLLTPDLLTPDLLPRPLTSYQEP